MAKNYVKILFLAIKRTAYPLNNSDHSIWGFWRWNIQWDYPFCVNTFVFNPMRGERGLPPGTTGPGTSALLVLNNWPPSIPGISAWKCLLWVDQYIWIYSLGLSQTWDLKLENFIIVNISVFKTQIYACSLQDMPKRLSAWVNNYIV